MITRMNLKRVNILGMIFKTLKIVLVFKTFLWFKCVGIKKS
jgi:hypothetical protein